MRIESASGTILRTRPLTETSVIVHWLTPHLGRLATVAKGARRPKSAFHGKLDLFYECDFSFSRSARSDLHTLREVVVRNTHEALRHEMGWIQQAAHAAALIEQTTETDTPLPGIHDLFVSLLNHLPNLPPKPRTVFAFELRLLRELGLGPDLSGSKLTAGVQDLAESLLDLDWGQLESLRPTAAQARTLHQYLHGFLIYHLGKLPRGRRAAVGGLASGLE